VLQDGIKHDAENCHEDDHANDHHENVKVPLVSSQFGGWSMQVQLIDSWASRQIIDGISSRRQTGQRSNAAVGNFFPMLAQFIHFNILEKQGW
jgi:hypothetical protein